MPFQQKKKRVKEKKTRGTCTRRRKKEVLGYNTGGMRSKKKKGNSTTGGKFAEVCAYVCVCAFKSFHSNWWSKTREDERRKKKEVADETGKEGKGRRTRGEKKFRALPTRGAARNARVEFKRNVCTRKNEADCRTCFFMVAYTVSPERKKKAKHLYFTPSRAIWKDKQADKRDPSRVRMKRS